MNVNSPASVVTRENGLEQHNSLVTTRLNAAEESGVNIRRVVRVTVTTCGYTGVNTLKHGRSGIIRTM
jgi:hypothetical protein